MEELAVAALEASGKAVADALSQALDAAPDTAEGLIAFLDTAAGPVTGAPCPGCPIAPTALESPILSPRLREAATRCFEQWEALIAARLRADGWPEDTTPQTASAALSLIEGALLLARVSGRLSHLANAKQATTALLAAPTERSRRRNPTAASADLRPRPR
jgi:TetR/AcrR family transcriptional repressor of lmrAB and yxaGH operons